MQSCRSPRDYHLTLSKKTQKRGKKGEGERKEEGEEEGEGEREEKKS